MRACVSVFAADPARRAETAGACQHLLPRDCGCACCVRELMLTSTHLTFADEPPVCGIVKVCRSRPSSAPSSDHVVGSRRRLPSLAPVSSLPPPTTAMASLRGLAVMKERVT